MTSSTGTGGAGETRLQLEARRYEALISSEGSIVWVLDLDLRPTGRNHGWEMYTGLQPDQYLELGWLSALHPDDQPLVKQEAARARAAGLPVSLELRVRRADGEYRRNAIRAIPIRQDGRIVEWIGTANDVEDARRASDDQRDLRARLLALTQGAEAVLSTRSEQASREAALGLARRVLPGDAHAIWWFDATAHDWRIVASSGLSERYASQRLPGEPVAFAEPRGISDVHTADILQARRDAFLEEGIRSLFIVPLPIGSERRAAIVIYSRQHREWTETELRVGTALGQVAGAALWNAESYEQLQRARRDSERANQAKDEFLAILSHELRTPLNAIMGWSHMLRDGLPEEMARHALEVIARNARAQKQLVEDLLDVARIAGGRIDLQPAPLDLRDVGRVAVDSALPAAQAKNITLSFEGPAGAIPVTGDANRLQQVLANLLSNALKFTDAGGRVTVRVAVRDGRAAVSVSDTGIGIAADFLPNVFERFRQADASLTRPYPGLGLGLWIVKQLIEAHGGTVEAESLGRGHGTTVTVMLPLA